MTENADRVWRVGELAQAAGLTVRALHHYDRIGLLHPSLRSKGNHRLYAESDAARLYEIVALRGLGLPLEQVREVLAGSVDPRALIAEQQRALTVQLKAGARLHDRLSATLSALDATERPAVDDLLALVRQTVAVESLAADHLGSDLLARLGDRRAVLGEPASAQLAGRLTNLYEQALAEYDAGTDPHDPTVQAIVEEIDRTGAELSNGDEQVSGSVRRLWAEHGEEVYPGAGIPWAALAEYLERARVGGAATSQPGSML